MFVYVDPGYDTSTAIRSWADAHKGLWQALVERDRFVEVIAVICSEEELDRAQAILQHRTEASGPVRPTDEARAEIARIEQAILQGSVQVLEEYGGLQAVMRGERGT